MAHHHVDISKENTRLGDLGMKIAVPALLVGAVGLGVVLVLAVMSEPDMRSRILQGYLVNFMFILGIGLGGMFFTLIHHLTRAGWSVVVRRVGEAIAAGLPWMALLFLPLLWALFSKEIQLFEWATTLLEKGDPLVLHKYAYLNTGFFLVRAAIYFAIWIVISRWFFRLSVQQDSTGDIEPSHRMTSHSAPAMILFGLTLTFAAFDWLMTQDSHWFSTIWGVYYFAGAVAAFLASAILIFLFVQRTGRLQHSVTTEHYHDLGKLLFAFGIVFWAYIAYSQYMLQWYGNIPEETLWWQPRASGHPEPVYMHGHEAMPGGWNGWSMFLFLGHFAVPFLLAMSRWTKRIKPMLGIAAGWMLVMCWFDIFWIVMPVFYPEPAALPFHFTDLLSLAGIGGVMLGMLALRLREVSLIPIQDPRLNESLSFQNV